MLVSSPGVPAGRKGSSHLPSKVGQRTEHKKQEGSYRASCVMLLLASLGLFRPQSPPPYNGDKKSPVPRAAVRNE